MGVIRTENIQSQYMFLRREESGTEKESGGGIAGEMDNWIVKRKSNSSFVGLRINLEMN